MVWHYNFDEQSSIFPGLSVCLLPVLLSTSTSLTWIDVPREIIYNPLIMNYLGPVW
jgi:hypothetical protein